MRPIRRSSYILAPIAQHDNVSSPRLGYPSSTWISVNHTISPSASTQCDKSEREREKERKREKETSDLNSPLMEMKQRPVERVKRLVGAVWLMVTKFQVCGESVRPVRVTIRAVCRVPSRIYIYRNIYITQHLHQYNREEREREREREREMGLVVT